MLFISQTYHKSNSSSGYILEVDVKYSEELHGLHSDMPFLPNKMKVNKFEKLACNFFNKKTHVIHIKARKQVLNLGLILEKIHKLI